MRCLTTCLASATLIAGAGAYTYFQDFESMSLGDLDGQDGWVGSASGGDAPQVVDYLGNRVVKLATPDVSGTNSRMERPIDDLVALGCTKVAVTFDVLRRSLDASLVQNLWWYWFDTGQPTYGLQWDQGNQTMPFGFNPGAGATATVFDRFVTLRQEWDLSAGLARSWYDGNPVDVDYPITDIAQLTGWAIELAHDAAGETGRAEAYIDNFGIEAVPEPTGLTALALGALALVGRRRR
ncbi:MAG: PEP-CTERM sorting domain-containing protein [Fimbriimonadaceae bacterium]